MLGESYLENSMCEYFIFRSSWIYANDSKNFYNTIYKKILLEKENIKVVNDQFGIPTSTFISKIFEIYLIKFLIIKKIMELIMLCQMENVAGMNIQNLLRNSYSKIIKKRNQK